MTWVCLPHRLFVQDVFDVLGVWWRSDGSYLAFIGPSAVVLVAPANLFPRLSVSGETLALGDGLYNYRPFFECAGGAFFFSIARAKWVYNPDGLAEPVSIVDPDTGDEIGDGWYEADDGWSFDPFAESFPSVTLSAHGSASGAATIVVDWPHWRRTGYGSDAARVRLGGDYSPLCGASGTVSIGVAAWRRSADSVIFLHRSGGSYSAPATDAEIVPAASIDEEDETGDYVFSDAPHWRLRALPEDGSSAYYYTLSNGSYASAGQLVQLGTRAVPRIPSVPAGALPYSGELLVASPPQWT